MILGFIGMSGAGKTSWATRLAANGFECIHCDELIAAQISQTLNQSSFSVYDLGDWLGLPYTEGFQQREVEYLAHEAAALQIALDQAAQHDASHNLIIDMGGSVIYLDPALLARVRQIATVVYFAITPQLHAQLLQEYLRQPRSLIWQGMFQPEAHESLEATFTRCYSRLISYREQHYAALSHVTLEHAFYSQPELSTEAFLRAVHAATETAH